MQPVWRVESTRVGGPRFFRGRVARVTGVRASVGGASSRAYGPIAMASGKRGSIRRRVARVATRVQACVATRIRARVDACIGLAVRRLLGAAEPDAVTAYGRCVTRRTRSVRAVECALQIAWRTIGRLRCRATSLSALGVTRPLARRATEAIAGRIPAAWVGALRFAIRARTSRGGSRVGAELSRC